jgi:hypothetical protein
MFVFAGIQVKRYPFRIVPMRFVSVSRQEGTQMKPEQKEELIEMALLCSPENFRGQLQQWWNSVIWEVRD